MADTYTQFGPWTSGGAPGIDAPFLNPLETFLLALSNRGMGYANFNVTPLSLTGATSGTATLYQFVAGTYKYVFARMNNFRNGSGSHQSIALPTPFTSYFQFHTGDFANVSFLSGGVSGTVRSCGVITGLSATGGSVGSVTVIANWSIGECLGGWDTLRFNSGAAGANQGTIVIQGV